MMRGGSGSANAETLAQPSLFAVWTIPRLRDCGIVRAAEPGNRIWSISAGGAESAHRLAGEVTSTGTG